MRKNSFLLTGLLMLVAFMINAQSFTYIQTVRESVPNIPLQTAKLNSTNTVTSPSTSMNMANNVIASWVQNAAETLEVGFSDGSIVYGSDTLQVNTIFPYLSENYVIETNGWLSIMDATPGADIDLLNIAQLQANTDYAWLLAGADIILMPLNQSGAVYRFDGTSLTEITTLTIGLLSPIFNAYFVDNGSIRFIQRGKPIQGLDPATGDIFEINDPLNICGAYANATFFEDYLYLNYGSQFYKIDLYDGTASMVGTDGFGINNTVIGDNLLSYTGGTWLNDEYFYYIKTDQNETVGADAYWGYFSENPTTNWQIADWSNWSYTATELGNNLYLAYFNFFEGVDVNGNPVYIENALIIFEYLDEALTTDIESTPNGFELIISPNPFTDLIEIQGMPIGEKQLNVFDCTGRMICQITTDDTDEIIDLSGLNAGVYFLSMEASSGRYVEKLIRQ